MKDKIDKIYSDLNLELLNKQKFNTSKNRSENFPSINPNGPQ